MKNFWLIFMYALFTFACDDQEDPGISVNFYALADYQTQSQSMKIMDNTVELSDSIIIPYADIIFYHSKTYTFFITDYLSEILSDWENHPLARKPFSVAVGGKLIYTGYFWYGFMSSGCDWVVIDPIDYSGEHKLTVRLGYPGIKAGDTIPDNRNDPRILEILRKDGKLVE
jgi:hypothetical protein